MTAASRQIENLIIHIGPHKTGTTSIQKLLCDNATCLRTMGIYYPDSPLMGGAHHHVPFLLHGWDLALLGLEPKAASGFSGIPPLATDIDRWLSAAQALSCHTVIISAEDFSTLTRSGWTDFAQALENAQVRNAIRFSKITICLTERSIAERAHSQFAESLKHGLASAEGEVHSLLLAQLAHADAVVQNIPDFFETPVHVQRVAYRRPDASTSFLMSWVEDVLGITVLQGLPTESWDTQLNHRISERSQERLLAFNKINTPASGDIFRPFHASSAPDEDRDRARIRLAMMVEACQDLEKVEFERDQVRLPRHTSV